MLGSIGTIYKCKGKKYQKDLSNFHKILSKKIAILLALSTERDSSKKQRFQMSCEYQVFCGNTIRISSEAIRQNSVFSLKVLIRMKM